MKHPWLKLEPAIAVFYLLISFDVALPSPFGKLVNVGSYGVVALLFLMHWRRILYVATRDKWLWVLVGLALFSVVWSASPASTLNSGRALIRSVLFGAYLATCYSPKEQMRIYAWMTGIAAIVSLFAGALIPSYGTAADGVWRGIYTHKQYLGRMMTVGAATLVLTCLDSKRYRWLSIAALLVALGLIFLSQSKTALVLYLLSLAILPIYRIINYYYKTQVIFYMLFLLISGAVGTFLFGNWQDIVVNVLGKDPNLTGRQEVWALAIERGLERPWLGYGFSGFWGSSEAEYVIRNTWAEYVLEAKSAGSFHAHNGFIDLFLWLGAIGLVLFILHFLMVFARTLSLFRRTKATEYFWMIQIIVLMLLYNTTEVVLILSQGNQLWIAYVAIAFSSALQLERLERAKRAALSTDEVQQVTVPIATSQ